MPDAQPPHRLDLAYRGTATCVRAHDESTLVWLAEFLAPWFERSPHANADGATVILAAGDGDFDRWLAASTDLAEMTECFTLDAGREPWHLRRGPDGDRAAVEPRGRVALAHERGDVLIRARSEHAPYARITLMRVLRELAIARGALRGALGLHASAVARGDEVTLFAGAKRAGKSTLLLHTLRSTTGARFVSNDRVELRREADAAVARGMPTIVSLRPGTLARHEDLQTALATKAWHWPITVAEAERHARDGTAVNPPSTRPVPGLGSAQLAALMGIGLQAEGRVARIVYPHVERRWQGGPGFELQRLTAAQAQEAVVARGLIGAGRLAPFLLEDSARTALPTGRALVQAAHTLVAGVPCFALRLGKRAYESPALLDALDLGDA